jgi:hypothetical protein
MTNFTIIFANKVMFETNSVDTNHLRHAPRLVHAYAYYLRIIEMFA